MNSDEARPSSSNDIIPTQGEILDLVGIQKQVDDELDQHYVNEMFDIWKGSTATTPNSFSRMQTPQNLSVASSPRPGTPIIKEMLEQEGDVPRAPCFDALNHRRTNMVETVKNIVIEQQQDISVKSLRPAKEINLLPVSVPGNGVLMNREEASDHLRNMFSPTNHLFIRLDEATKQPATIPSVHQSELILARNSKLWAKSKETTFLAVKTVADSTYHGLFNEAPENSYYGEFLKIPKHVEHPDMEWKILTKFGGLEFRVWVIIFGLNSFKPGKIH